LVVVGGGQIGYSLKLNDLAMAIHPYPTCATPVRQMAANISAGRLLGSIIR
jgi:hypothetical protein